jgi:hypothetical protein
VGLRIVASVIFDEAISDETAVLLAVSNAEMAFQINDQTEALNYPTPLMHTLRI